MAATLSVYTPVAEVSLVWPVLFMSRGPLNVRAVFRPHAHLVLVVGPPSDARWSLACLQPLVQRLTRVDYRYRGGTRKHFSRFTVEDQINGRKWAPWGCKSS